MVYVIAKNRDDAFGTVQIGTDSPKASIYKYISGKNVSISIVDYGILSSLNLQTIDNDFYANTKMNL